MADAALVKEDFDAGLKLVRMLDNANFPVTGAAWMHEPDEGKWRLVIRSPKAASNLQDAYLDVARIMDANGDLRARIDLTRVRLVPPDDRLLAAIGSVVQVEGRESVTFSGNMVNGIYIDDAVIYRLAA